MSTARLTMAPGGWMAFTMVLMATGVICGGCGTVPQFPPPEGTAPEDGSSVPSPTSFRVQSIAPAAGISDGNVYILIEGTGFQTGTEVLFGDEPAEDVVVVSEEIITLTTPRMALGPVDVTLRSPSDEELILAAAYEVIPNYCTDPTDEDGDGLTNCEEKLGHEILVDYFGFGLNNETSQLKMMVVTSDPRTGDTDGDGLTDLEELLRRSNPRVGDTDRDGLGDWEEVNRWLTSPSSVDTDGDARGPEGLLPPDASLFDGNELETVGFTTTEDLYFSEYVEGSQPDDFPNRALEIYNGTGSDVSFDNDGDGVPDYTVVLHADAGDQIIPLTGNVNPPDSYVLVAGDVFVLANENMPIPGSVVDQTVTLLQFDGATPITLRKNGVIIDAIGQDPPFDPPAIDQDSPGGDSATPLYVPYRSQFFTAGRTGSLESIEVFVENTDIADGAVPVAQTMRLIAGPSVAGAELGQAIVAIDPGFAGYVTWTIPANVIAENQYTWVLDGQMNSTLRIFASDTDVYPGGHSDLPDLVDYRFRTKVAPRMMQWGSGSTSTIDHTLRRNPGVCVGDADSADAFAPAGEWSGFPIDTFGGLGEHVAVCPQRIVAGGTSPSLDDTDGDGRTDYEEADDPTRSPLIADLPRARLGISGDVDVRLFVEYTDSVGTETSYSNTFTESQTTSVSRYSATSVSANLENSTTVGTEVGVKIPPGVTVTAENTTTFSLGLEKSWSTTTESSSTSQQESSRARADSLTREETASRGEISAGFVVENVGNVTFTLADLAVTIRQFIPDLENRHVDPRAGSFRTVGTLLPQVSAVSLGPGDRTPVLQVSDDDVNPDVVKEFLAQPTSLFFEAASYELEDVEGRNFAFLNEVTRAQTATILIDYGDAQRPAERYVVATNVDRETNSAFAGIPLRRALEQLVGLRRYICEGVSDPDGYVLERRQVNAEQKCLGTGSPVLTHVRGFGPDTVPGSFWVLAKSADATASVGSLLEVEFDEITLRAGDAISLILTRDDDGDTLSLAEELYYGTSDATADTDGDGVDDVEEIEGWDVTVDGLTRAVVSDPRVEDTDRDGVSDLQERDNDPTPLDPSDPDTDGDGIDDELDAFPLIPAVRLYVDITGGTGSCSPSATGTCWDDPHVRLQDALADAVIRNGPDGDDSNNVGEIWVAQGTYPTNAGFGQMPSDVTATFRLLESVGIYGGFSGNESLRVQRNQDPFTNDTVLTGELVEGGNAYHIVTSDTPIMTDSTILDGFTLSGGVANGTDPHDRGGAILVAAGRPTLRNLLIIDNEAKFGGGMYDLGGATLIDSTFTQNSGLGGGGGLYVSSTSAGTNLIGCRFIRNETAASGGAIVLAGATVEMSDCILEHNVAKGTWGGGMLVDVNSTAKLSNCRFLFNSALNGGAIANLKKLIAVQCAFYGNSSEINGGGLIASGGASPETSLFNCTFTNNFAGNPAIEADGGGVFIAEGTTTIQNCVFHRNHSSIVDGWTNHWESNLRMNSAPLDIAVVTSNIIQNCLNPSNPACQAFPFLQGGNLQVEASTTVIMPGLGMRLAAGSPAIDAGDEFIDIDPNTTGVQFLPAADAGGKPRIVDGNGDGIVHVDIGAHEFQPEDN